MSKEMLGGCCVCSDERGWTENPLVYCDGQGCTVAVHQACYGIVTVPTGPWFCRKCESQERSARVRCELCPSKDGALKRTDNSGWAHVVCALYIPEVRFGNVTTMEPIILQLIPTERFSKVCYLCQEQGKGAKSTVGACMQCNKAGCKLQFHVTCAQALGLLCEEAGNYLDNVKYCGYCQHHYSKLKKGGNVKTIPPYKPISAADNGSSDSSPEKDSESLTRISSGKKKFIVTPKPNLSGIKSKSHSPVPSPTPDTITSAAQSSSSTADIQPDNEPVTLKIGTTSSHSYQPHEDQRKKFTTSNFVESVVTLSEPVFGADKTLADGKGSMSYGNNKKRKLSAGSMQLHNKLLDNNNDQSNPSSNINASGNTNTSSPTGTNTLTVNLKNPTVSITNLKTNVISSTGKSSVSASAVVAGNAASAKSSISGPVCTTKSNLTVTGSGTKITISTQRATSVTATSSSGGDVATGEQVVKPGDSPSKKGKLDLTASVALPGPSPSCGIVVSVPLTAATCVDNNSKVANVQHPQQDAAPTAAGGAVVVVSATPGAGDVKQTGVTDAQPAKRARSTSSEKGRKNRRSGGGGAGGAQSKRIGRSSSGSSSNLTVELNQEQIKDSPPDSPIDERKINRKKTNTGNHVAVVKTEDKDVKPFQNVSVPHMLGNQLNPSSVMAQKMHDSLSQEIEAHSIFNSEPSAGSTLVGPQLPSKVIAAVRPSVPEKTNSPTPGGGGGVLGSTNQQPQSLDQLLERQWEQGSQFLMEQAQHFDIASLLSCLHQLKAENLKLEESVNSLLQRRDHLLAVNARLAVPLTTQPSTTQANQQTSVTQQQQANLANSRISHAVFENGLSNEPTNYPVQPTHNRTVGQASPAIRHNPTQSMYNNQGGGAGGAGTGGGGGVVRTTGVNMDQRRQTQTNYSGYHGQVPVVTSPSMNIRRDDLHQHM